MPRRMRLRAIATSQVKGALRAWSKVADFFQISRKVRESTSSASCGYLSIVITIEKIGPEKRR